MSANRLGPESRGHEAYRPLPGCWQPVLLQCQLGLCPAGVAVDAIKVGTAHLVLIDGEEREPAATIAAVVTAVASWPAS